MVDVIQVELGKVAFRSNYRQAYDESFLQSVAGDMAENGYNPTYPMECYANADGTYTTIDGNTRWNAAQLAQVYSISTRLAIPFLVWIAVGPKPKNFSLKQIKGNKDRRDTDPVSDAIGYKNALDEGATVDEIVRECKTTVTAVNDRLALLALTADIQELVIKGHLGIKYASAMSALDSNRQRMAVQAYNKAQSPSIPAFKAMCEKLYAEQLAESQTDFFGLYTAEEMAAKASELADSISSEPKRSLKQLEAELEAEKRARKQDRDFAKAKVAQLLKVIEAMERQQKELAA
jgi:ParB-like chromosome segregation protein Spo0J